MKKTNKKMRFNPEAVKELIKKFALIDSYIIEGKEIPPELTKNFVTCELVDDPYSLLE